MIKPNKSIKDKIMRIYAETEAVPNQPLLELSGDNRILIENHLGIVEYEPERIQVKMKFGFLSICGNCMTMAQISCDQLVIVGMIHSITIHKREERF